MYVERIRELADFIVRNHFPFNYSQLDQCIAGHAVRLWGDRICICSPSRSIPSDRKLADFLDISLKQLDQLCYQGEVPYSTITRQKAAGVLHHFANTGEVVWR